MEATTCRPVGAAMALAGLLMWGCAGDAAAGNDAGAEDGEARDVGAPKDGAGAADADAAAAQDALESDGLPNLVRLSNSPEGCTSTSLAPAPGEENLQCAARLSPPVYPFAVRSVGYMLAHGSAGGVTCNATLAHEIEVFAAASVAPPASPAGAIRLSVEAITEAQLTPEGRPVSKGLDPPLVLAQGEHLFIAIHFAGTYPDVLCVPVTTDGSPAADRNYWSTTTSAPYDWVTLESLGLPGTILVYAYGSPLP